MIQNRINKNIIEKAFNRSRSHMTSSPRGRGGGFQMMTIDDRGGGGGGFGQ